MSQSAKLFLLLSDGEPHSTIEIMDRVYGGSHLGLARVGARIYDIKKDGYEIKGWKDKVNPAIYWYQMKLVTSDSYKVQANLFPTSNQYNAA